jgi:hypothetical protein
MREILPCVVDLRWHTVTAPSVQIDGDSKLATGILQLTAIVG